MALINKLTVIANNFRTSRGIEDKLSLDQMAELALESTEGDVLKTATDMFVHRTITEVSDDTITSVLPYQFYNCSDLISVDLPSVTTIGIRAFSYCESLTSINLPLVTTAPDTQIFSHCSNLQEISLPNIETLGNYSFQTCSSLTTVFLPKLTVLKERIFHNCAKLTILDFPLVTSIEALAFQNCLKLSHLILRSETVCSLAYNSAFQTTPIESGTGYIYVPSSLVDNYKAANNWSNFADQIRAIEDYPDICG